MRPVTRHKSITGEVRQIELASRLIMQGARIQMLVCETTLSRERLLRLYKELVGKSPPKGMFPSSTTWFTTWQPNIHSSLFMNIYDSLLSASPVERVDALVGAYSLYRDQIAALGLKPVISLTRAWGLIKFFEAGMLVLTPCIRSGGRFVAHRFDPIKCYVCGLCNMPSRAGTLARPKPSVEAGSTS